jgi:CHAT domain-containing protein/tetratricopeptide (TPR) repeat protein
MRQSWMSKACGSFLLLLAGLGSPSFCLLAAPPTIQQADELYRQDELPAAEQAYRQILGTLPENAERQRCYSRLLSIYGRLGRPDQSIGIALDYQQWAERTGNRQQARELNFALGEGYLTLGHYDDAEKSLRRALQPDRAGTTLTPARKVVALSYLALNAEKRGDRDQAASSWREVEVYARGLLDKPARELEPPQRIACTQNLANSYRFQGKPEQAIPRLEQLLPLHERLKDLAGQRDTLRLLAEHLVADRRLADAERRLREAIRLDEQLPARNPLTRGDLANALADVLERQKKPDEAAPWRTEAIRSYQAMQTDGRSGKAGRSGALSAFWKLQTVYQRSGHYDRALALTQELGTLWRGEFLIEPRLKAEQGSLQIVLGKFRQSRPLLREAVANLEKQSPRNLIELPRALLNLAVVEMATGGQSRAVALARQCVKLYRDHHLPDDLLVVEAHNVLGTCAAQEGDYAQAIDQFREGVACCGRLGPAAEAQHANLLLNMALVHKAQGDLGQALAFCRKAETIQRRLASPESLTVAALWAAQASLLATQVKLEEANRLSGDLLRLCEKKGIRGGLLVIVARHCQALYRLHRRDFAGAEQTWRAVQELQGPDAPLLPRTLNYRALTRECQMQFSEAEVLYRQARKLQTGNPRAYPVTHFATLWRLANVVDRQRRHIEARTLLGEAIGVVEQARGRVYGEASQRAAFFAQFEPGFDQLVEWSIRDGDTNGAVATAARARSRTLLDQLLLAKVDPRKGLSQTTGGQLLRQEAALRQQMATLRAQARLLSPESLASKEARELLGKFEETQRQYAEVYREILNANPVYRSLSQPEFSATELALLQKKVLGPKKLLLVYYVGRERSFLLLLGGRLPATEAFPLMVPDELSRQAIPPKPLPLKTILARTRGLRPVEVPPQPELPSRPPTHGRMVPLTQRVLRALVGTYLQQVAEVGFDANRGLRPVSYDPERPLPVERPEFLADILLPPGVRQRIREQAPECLVVVPDGALHKLPLESLLLRAGREPVYALDELPPVVYAPSVAILAMLGKRRPVAAGGPLTLLTVAAPAYPETKTLPPIDRTSPQWALMGLRSELPRLEFAGQESRRIAALFPSGKVTPLIGVAATEKAVLAALPGKRIIHLAVHGFADNRFGNRFGALALMPPSADREKAEDGFLSLHELYNLRLPDCDLAVLSACQTNVGPQEPLEGGVTLAGGFLAAGARRVLASHWSVSDQSTADLMEAFFQEAMTATRRGQPVFYPAALQKAQRRVRQQKGQAAPFFWAPFVLVGAAD